MSDFESPRCQEHRPIPLAQLLCRVGWLLIASLAGAVFAQTLDDTELVTALQGGGYVIVMRHASSPSEAPDAEEANPDNVNQERQLDEAGRNDAVAMGASLRRLDIPIVEVASSPTYRTLETARLAGFNDIRIREYLGNQGMRNSSESNTAQLLENVKNAPAQGNRLVITHSPNIAAAFPELMPEVKQGEALVFNPEVSVTIPVARINIRRWPGLR